MVISFGIKKKNLIIVLLLFTINLGQNFLIRVIGGLIVIITVNITIIISNIITIIVTVITTVIIIIYTTITTITIITTITTITIITIILIIKILFQLMLGLIVVITYKNIISINKLVF